MAKPKSKSTKKQLFEDEEFELEEQNDAELETKEDDQDLEEINDIPPETLLEEEEEIEDVSPTELEAVIAEEHEDELPVTPGVIEEDGEGEREHEEAPGDEESPVKNVVIKCPHCHEEVVDMEICPLCGNPLKLTVDAMGERLPDEDDLMFLSEDYYFDDEDAAKHEKQKGFNSDEEDALFGGLTSYGSDHIVPGNE